MRRWLMTRGHYSQLAAKSPSFSIHLTTGMHIRWIGFREHLQSWAELCVAKKTHAISCHTAKYTKAASNFMKKERPIVICYWISYEQIRGRSFFINQQLYIY